MPAVIDRRYSAIFSRLRSDGDDCGLECPSLANDTAGGLRVVSQFGVVAASLPRHVAASRSDRDRSHRRYVKLRHYRPVFALVIERRRCYHTSFSRRHPRLETSYATC